MTKRNKSIVMGSAGSGKTRYLYSVARKKAIDGNNCLIISNEENGFTFLELTNSLKDENVKGSIKLIKLKLDMLDVGDEHLLGDVINKKIYDDINYIFIDVMGINKTKLEGLIKNKFNNNLIEVYITMQLSKDKKTYKDTIDYVNSNLPLESLKKVILTEKLQYGINVWESKIEEPVFDYFKEGTAQDNLKDFKLDYSGGNLE